MSEKDTVKFSDSDDSGSVLALRKAGAA